MKRRNKEIETLTYNTVVYLVWIFVIWICPIIGFILMMICVGYNGTTDYFTVENTVLFLKVYFLIMEAMFAIPSCVEYLLDIRNSMNKIRDFLDTTDELIVSKRQRRRNKKRFMSKDSGSNQNIGFSTELHMRDGGRDSYDLNEADALQQATMKENIEDSVNQIGNFFIFSAHKNFRAAHQSSAVDKKDPEAVRLAKKVQMEPGRDCQPAVNSPPRIDGIDAKATPHRLRKNWRHPKNRPRFNDPGNSPH